MGLRSAQRGIQAIRWRMANGYVGMVREEQTLQATRETMSHPVRDSDSESLVASRRCCRVNTPIGHSVLQEA